VRVELSARAIVVVRGDLLAEIVLLHDQRLAASITRGERVSPTCPRCHDSAKRGTDLLPLASRDLLARPVSAHLSQNVASDAKLKSAQIAGSRTTTPQSK
jgi:hypothetical protein